jgi:hypothetical protein
VPVTVAVVDELAVSGLVAIFGATDDNDSIVMPEVAVKVAVAKAASVTVKVMLVPDPAVAAVPPIKPLEGSVGKPAGKLPAVTAHE